MTEKRIDELMKIAEFEKKKTGKSLNQLISEAKKQKQMASTAGDISIFFFFQLSAQLNWY